MNLEVGKIGVYGMGGVGKTTIMTQVYNQLRTMDDFEIVIWVTVSSSFNEKELQNRIAEGLDCQLSSSADLMSRAQVLHEAFRRRRNFVIILDDIWERVSLQNVGIPEPDGSNRSKVVWTTRSMNVCNSMESEKEIKVGGLTDEEAWSLFKEKVGAEDVIMSTEILPIAKQVAKECGGLPLALITVGRALRKTYQPSVWRNALQQLKTSRADQIHGMGEEVFGSLKFSYNWLSSDKIHACFLYCALYPEDYIILVDELIEYWRAEGLIDEEGSIQTEKDKGHAYLQELKDACMIENIEENNKYVRMHDLIRDLAINITRDNPKQPLFMVKAGLGLMELPKEEEWVESLQRVSLMRNDIKAFRGQPNCPRLSTLLLHHKPSLIPSGITFSDTFFKHMHGLKVLNLSNTGIKSLPDSISLLVNLQTLILTSCSELECLPSLAKLQKLRLLALGGLESLKELPHGLENLVKLRHLDISNGGWGGFRSKALLKMPCLEILYMHKGLLGFGGYVVDNSTVDQEIISLKKLTRFSADFNDVLTFNSYISRANEFDLLKIFDRLLFTVSYIYDGHNVENESMDKVMLPSATNYLEIAGRNFVQLSDFFGFDELRRLIYCRIQKCKKMLWIGGDGEIVLPSLKRLHLTELHSFKGLCKEKAHEKTFKNLTHLMIEYCHKLKYLIPIDLLVNNLQNLEMISIVGCHEMEDIISGEASADMTALPKLKMLSLRCLPSLSSICQGKLVCDLLSDIDLIHCPKLKRLPFLISNKTIVSAKITGSQEWWEALAWEGPQLKEHLQPFFDESDEMDEYARRLRNIIPTMEQMFKIARLNFQDEKDEKDFLSSSIFYLERCFGIYSY
ncbi:disease resistance protein At4g27190-like [Dioscorea cayenensis subsp. rotundata]|uniref:Disease resistance protein At4g27190-like n=1 Tax=Dioscorea cayennensis subsp. rotundata TaxID=55577 RepID=A0AB40CK48_DIOCR|nr:disease resistance protein At4g27190-like [Dioscorea cayenensis subsp. rotundata]